MNATKWAGIAAFSLAIAVGLGAWNAHGMEKWVEAGKISEKYLKTFHTGVTYQFIQSLGLMLLAFGIRIFQVNLKYPLMLIFIGMLLFSGSLYVLSFHEILGEGFKKLGVVTPFGGVAMIAGWLWTGFTFIKQKTA